MLKLPPRLTAVIRRASTGSDSDDLARLLQDRVVLFARLLGGVLAFLYVAGAAITFVVIPSRWAEVNVHPSKLLGLVILTATVVIGYGVLRRTRAAWLIHTLDAGLVLLLSLTVATAVVIAPGGYHLEFAALLIMVLALVMRSAIVPSTAQRTLVIGLLATPPVTIAGYLHIARNGADDLIPASVIAAGLGMWCLATTFVSVEVSRVIYGLVVQVQTAMQLGRYTLREKIGEGGMGAVYRAEHAMLRRATAVKLLLPERVSAGSLARFEREVQLTSQLTHPNTIAVHDYGRTPEGVFYYAMEFIHGRTLERLVAQEGPQPPGRVVHIIAQVAGSLREAHAHGLIHRDIKPGNVLLSTYGGMPDFAKVIDFGLVKHIDPALDLTLTREGSLVGTPLFMAPETITRPDMFDSAVDTYALGSTAYFLLTGEPPFNGRTLVEVCAHHLHTAPLPPSQRARHRVPPKLDALIVRCLAKDPSERPTDAELSRLLRECQAESPWDPDIDAPSGAIDPAARTESDDACEALTRPAPAA